MLRQMEWKLVVGGHAARPQDLESLLQIPSVHEIDYFHPVWKQLEEQSIIAGQAQPQFFGNSIKRTG